MFARIYSTSLYATELPYNLLFFFGCKDNSSDDFRP